MKLEEFIEEKLNRFKFLIAENITNESNEHFTKLMEYNIDDIVFFYETNIKAYLNMYVGLDTIVNSFMTYLEMDLNNIELKEKIKLYFELFNEILNSNVNIEDNKIEDGCEEQVDTGTEGPVDN
jgi:hypothetical protein